MQVERDAVEDEMYSTHGAPGFAIFAGAMCERDALCGLVFGVARGQEQGGMLRAR